jgi:hypothetical protein
VGEDFDAVAVAQLILQGLPMHASWMIAGQRLRYDFSQARDGLLPVADEIEPELFRESWRSLRIFGAADYADRGGATSWLTIDSSTGAVMGLDLERDEELYLINSSLPRFIATFTYLDRFLASGQRLPSDAEDVVRSIDALAFPASEWRALIEHLAFAPT